MVQNKVISQETNLIVHAIPAEGNTQSLLHQRPVDGYVNATELCKAEGKFFKDYAYSDTTKDFLKALERISGIPKSLLVQSVKGGVPHLQGTWVHPEVAINLGQWLSPEFAVHVSRLVLDWKDGKLPRKYLPHMGRYKWNKMRTKPATHFSIIDETYLALFGEAEDDGVVIPKSVCPDISVGRSFAEWLRRKNIDTTGAETYNHWFPERDERHTRFPVKAQLYPNRLLPEYKKFLYSVWLPKHGVKYLSERLPEALPYLTRYRLIEEKKTKILPFA